MKRRYDQFCGLARALDLVGERWTLLIVRDLALGPQRYSDLLAGLPGIGSGLLAERLHQLEDEGVARRGQLPPPANVAVWQLTDDGHDLAKAMAPLAVWGAKRLDGKAPDQMFRADWLLLTLPARFKPERARDVRDLYEFRVEDETVHVRIDSGAIEVHRGPAPMHADLVVTTDIETLLQLGLGTLDSASAVAQGRATIEGSPEAAIRALELLGP